MVEPLCRFVKRRRSRERKGKSCAASAGNKKMEKANYYVEDIIWDIDLEEGETYEEAREELELPTLVRLPEKLSEELDAEQADDEDVADYLLVRQEYPVYNF